MSCVKKKQDHETQAKDMYVSTLFRGMRRYAESHSDRWYILSAEHGLLDPTAMIQPYNLTLKTLSVTQRQDWALRVHESLANVLLLGDSIEILAGVPYRKHLVPLLTSDGYKVGIPLEGLGLGQQLQALKRINESG